MTISTESFNAINVGASANDGTGDSLRQAFVKVNDNFDLIADTGFAAGNIDVGGAIEVDDYLSVTGNVILGNTYVPSSNSSAGTAGQIVWDDDHVYICVDTDTWKRANLATW